MHQAEVSREDSFVGVLVLESCNKVHETACFVHCWGYFKVRHTEYMVVNLKASAELFTEL